MCKDSSAYTFRFLISSVIPCLSLAEKMERLGGNEIVGLCQSQSVYSITEECFAGFGTVHKYGLHAEKNEGSIRNKFRLLISINECRELILRLALHASR